MQEAYMYSCFATLWWWTFGVLFMLCHLVMVDFWGIIHVLPSCEGGLLSLAQVSFLSFVVTKVCCSTSFVATKIYCCDDYLLWRTYFWHDKHTRVCCDKSMFVATNICCNKSFVMTNTCLLRQTYFCCNKHILVVTCFVMTNTHFLQLICCDKCVCRDKTFAWQKRYLWQLPSMIDFRGITDALQPCESGLWGIILVMPPCDGAPFGVFLAD